MQHFGEPGKRHDQRRGAKKQCDVRVRFRTDMHCPAGYDRRHEKK
jgi:hypothetical protein